MSTGRLIGVAVSRLVRNLHLLDYLGGHLPVSGGFGMQSAK